MKYLVIVRFLTSAAWENIQREFAEREAAEAYAREMYAWNTEISVCIYEMIDCLN